MLARGALHIHTDLSHDGLCPISEMASFLRGRGYDFICIAEHSEDMDEAKVEFLRKACAELSSPDLCVIPGIEYSCSPSLHIAGIGCDLPLDDPDPAKLALSIRDAGGFAVLAHPRRVKWNCPDTLLRAVNAIETWNVRYDGKYLPALQSIDFVQHARRVNPSMLNVIGLDMHAQREFYPASIVLETDRLERVSIIASLTAGAFTLESPLWRVRGRCSMSRPARARLRAMRVLLDGARSLRDKLESRGTHK